MNCPYCGFDQTRVVNTRKNLDGVLRVRRCQQCRRTFDTSEEVFPPIDTRSSNKNITPSHNK
jgi:transcriptional regulator NrdR family protein